MSSVKKWLLLALAVIGIAAGAASQLAPSHTVVGRAAPIVTAAVPAVTDAIRALPDDAPADAGSPR